MKGVAQIVLVLVGFSLGITARYTNHTLTPREITENHSEIPPRNINLPRFTVTNTTPYSSYIPEANILVNPLPEGNYIDGKIRSRKLTAKSLECLHNQC